MANKKQYLEKILVLGDSGVGKTSLLHQYVNTKFTLSLKPTIGADFMIKELKIDDRMVTLQIWDTAGQERFNSLSKVLYRHTDCCVLVYDITNLKSFESLELWRSEFLDQGQPMYPEKFPFVVFGNKLDKANERQVSYEIAQSWCKLNGITQYFEVSAQDSTNLEQAFYEIAVISNSQEKYEQIFQDFPLLDKPKKKDYNSNDICC